MPTIPELLSGHVTLEVECLDRLYLNGYIGKLATSGGLVTFMREQLGKPIPSPVVLGQVTKKLRGRSRPRPSATRFQSTSLTIRNGRTMWPTKYAGSAGCGTRSPSSGWRRQRGIGYEALDNGFPSYA